MTSVWLRPLAETDLIDKTRYYRKAGGDDLGERFFEAAMRSLRSVERMPGIGSTSIGDLCGIPGLRAFPVKGFPARWYYFVADDQVDVVRLLSDPQDLPNLLGNTSDSASAETQRVSG